MAPALARADGGTVRVSQRCGDWRVTVFTDPTPLRAGPVDVSVLVQDAATGEPLLDHAIDVGVAPSDLSLAPARYRASHAAATNKLLQAAQFDLPHAGRWTFTVTVQARQESVFTRFELDVGDAPPAWQSLWPWFTWPFLAIASFVAFHRW